MKKILVYVGLVIFLSMAIFSPVIAADPTPPNAELGNLKSFKFMKHPNGIGYGSCPVYTAPSKDSYRCANGKATCATNAAMDEAGFVSGWLLVRYETNDGGCRVGYIPPEYVRGFKPQLNAQFGYVQAYTEEEILVTDNPLMHGTSFAVMSEGEEFHILGKYDYLKNNGLEWWYIECYVDEQIAYGFIEIDSNFHLGSKTRY